jgi:hypothetical protein
MLSAIISMDQADCQGIFLAPSLGAVPILLRKYISSTTVSSAAGVVHISSVYGPRTYRYMCFRFFTSSSYGKAATDVETQRLGDVDQDNIYSVNSHPSVPGRLLQARCVYAAII